MESFRNCMGDSGTWSSSRQSVVGEWGTGEEETGLLPFTKFEFTATPCSGLLHSGDGELSTVALGTCTTNPFRGVLGGLLCPVTLSEDLGERETFILGVKALLGGNGVDKPFGRTRFQSSVRAASSGVVVGDDALPL